MIKQTDIFKWNRIENNNYIEWIDSKIESLINEFWWYSFNNWLFRIHTYESIIKWTAIILEYFSDYKWKFILFWFDWVWRQFAVNKENENEIFLFDIATLEVFISDNNLKEFLLNISQYPERFLDENWFKEFNILLKYNESISHKVPLILWWQDVNSNMEVTDMEVDWGIVWQIMQQTR